MASTGEVWRLGHRPALDGLRGVAVLLVIASHAWDLPENAGAVGVAMFFTLSGFLITALLLEEWAARGRIDCRAFYLRRARRLLPALVVFLAVAVAVGKILDPIFATPGGALRALLYVSNWTTATGSIGAGGLEHTWSLSIEEQFYATFPLLVAFTLARGKLRGLAVVVAALIGASLLTRVVLWDGGHGAIRVYAGTDAAASQLLIGCLLAIGLHRGLRALRWWPSTATLLVLAAAGIIPGDTWGKLLVPVVVPVVVALLLWRIVTSAPPEWLASRWLVRVGRRSYALYLWHFPMVGMVRYTLNPAPWVTGLLVAASFGAAALSWRYVEEPFLRSRDRVRSADLLDRELVHSSGRRAVLRSA